MPCFNPNLMKHSIDPDTGRIYTTFLGNGRYTNPKDFGTPYVDSTWFSTVPCGRCEGCKMDYAREWANRMCLELQDNPDAIFLTLTYNDLHLPKAPDGYATLDKRDVQLFFKRLRKAFPDRKIRYYIAGEYGTHTHRPHYHAIIYNLSLTDFTDIVSRGSNEIGQLFFSSKQLENIWGNGFILMSTVSWKTCNYVARYVTKKQYGVDSDEIGSVLPPFNLSSRRPGIGMSQAEKLLKTGDTVFSLNCYDDVHSFPIPRSIIKRIKESGKDVDSLTEMLYNRTMTARNTLLSNLVAYDIPYAEILDKQREALRIKLNVLPERK